MKDTGIVRRIDELGRIVIPKEIRRTMRLKEGTPVQIFINEDGELTLTKYSPVVDITEFAQTFCDVVCATLDINIVVFDKDNVVAASSKLKNFLGKQISTVLEDVLEERKSYLLNSSDGSKLIKIFSADENTYKSQIIVPILANSDIVGGIVALSFENEATNFTMDNVKTLQTIANFMAKQVEWYETTIRFNWSIITCRRRTYC